MQTPEKKNIGIQYIVLFIGLGLLFAKFLAWHFTSSNAVLTDASESVVNVLAGIFTLYSVYLSSLPKDKNHPYGHGKVEFISSIVEGVLIVAAGVAMLIKTAYNYIEPDKLHQIDNGLLLILFAGIANGVLGYSLILRGKKTNSIAFISQGKHLFTDMITTGSVLIGLLIIYFLKLEWVDNVLALLISVYLVFTGIKIIRKSVGGIMDEADPILIKEIVEKLNNVRKSNWIDIHNFRVIKYGQTLHVDCHVTVPFYYQLEEAHDVGKEIENTLNTHFNNRVETFIHLDPCIPSSCRICNLAGCPKRSFAFEELIHWEYEGAVKNQKHI